MIRPLANHLRQFRFTAILAILAITAPSIYSCGSADELRAISICSGNTQDDPDAGIQAFVLQADILSASEGPDFEEDGEASDSFGCVGPLRVTVPVHSGSAHRKEKADLPLFILFHCLKVFTLL
jgi:hypothetical protein